MSDEKTAAYGADEGIALVLKADESGDWKAVADWLASHPDLAGEVAEFLAGQRGLFSDRAVNRSAPDLAGTTLGELELKEEIGHGGMGTVYRAFDPALRRDVAVKLLRAAGTLSTTDRARFRFEAEAAASLDHPHIVKVYSFGERDRVPFLVMPVMTGGSLSDKLKNLSAKRCLSPTDAAKLVRDVALGVHHAHQRGLIHRDLKPGNILLDDADRPHVADFGLARSLDASASVSGGIAGTPAYMSPEQVRGEKGLTTAADVWALGAILFELLTGRPPFGMDDVPSVLRRVVEDSTPTCRQLRPGIPPDLDAICRMCLEKRPGDRYHSAEELADDLSRFLRGEAVMARPRGVLADLGGALNWKRQTVSMNVFRTYMVGIVIHVLAHGTAAALVFFDHESWLYTLFTIHFCVWACAVWWQCVGQVGNYNPVERAGLAIHVGMFAAALTLFVAYCLRPGLDIVTIYLGFNIIAGLGLYVRGLTDWGIHFLLGLIYISQNMLLPFLPDWAWPAMHAVVGGAFFLWPVLHRRLLVREASLHLEPVANEPDASATVSVNRR